MNLDNYPGCYGYFKISGATNCLNCEYGDQCERFKIGGQNKHTVTELIKKLEENYWKINKNDMARVLRFNMHPHHLEQLTIAFLKAIADFDGYYPLLVNDIAKRFKHHESL